MLFRKLFFALLLIQVILHIPFTQATSCKYDIQGDISAFFKKLKHEEEVLIENNTDHAALLVISCKYPDQDDLVSHTIKIGPRRSTLFSKNKTYIKAVNLSQDNKNLFLNPKIKCDELKISIEDKANPLFFHQYIQNFVFRSVPYSDEDPLDDAEKQLKKGYNASCSYCEYIATQEGLSMRTIDEQRQTLYQENNIMKLTAKNTSLIDTSELKIPLITHKIWVTSEDNPRNPAKEYVQWFKNSIVHNTPTDGWRHIFWMENKKKLSQLASYLAEDPTIDIQEIDALDSSNFITGDLYKQAIKQKKFGKASDIVRLEILYELGGFYLDTDYELFQSLIPFAKAYDLVVGLEPMSVYICNAFIAVRPKHPVIKKTLELIKRNLSENAPKYVTRIPENDGFKTIVETGPAIFTLAFALAAGEGNNVDIVMPPPVLYPTLTNKYPANDIVIPNGKMPATAVGAHYWQTAWMNPLFDSKG